MIKTVHILIIIGFLTGMKGFGQEKLISKANEKYEMDLNF